MNEKRLMERLMSDPGESDKKSAYMNANVLIASIKGHLLRILNTRQGTVSIDKGYGVPDFSKLPGNFDSPETESMRIYIAAMVERYEPRLKGVEVVFHGKNDNDFSLKFRLSGEIAEKSMRKSIHINASFSSLNRFRID